jgi:hypothetical protein
MDRRGMPTPMKSLWIASAISLGVGATPACIEVPGVAPADGGDEGDAIDAPLEADASNADQSTEASADALGDSSFLDGPANLDSADQENGQPGGDGMGVGDSPAPE